ncbi:Magnetosome protein mamQ-g (greigite specific) [Candidatus Magnetomoraceae bacterium gMMP-15]
MASLENLSALELKEFLSRHVNNLQLLKKIIIILIVILILAVIAHIVYYFNYLTTLKFDVLTAKSQIESAMQYRANMVPVLIESLVSFVEHEDNVFNRAVDARERSLSAAKKITSSLRNSAGQPMKAILEKIIAIAEQYPALTSSTLFQNLMEQITGTEAEILKQRLDYNDKVNVYTTAISMFPGNIYASTIFNFEFYEYFQGSKLSEWPNFKGKEHSEWPQVLIQTEKAANVTQKNK